MLLDAARSTLLIIDVQARLAPAVDAADACVDRCRILIEAAKRLGVPVLISEQYPEGLGATVPALAELLPPNAIHAKRHFAGTDDAGLAAALAATGRHQVVCCGMEAHVCVLQTAFALKALGAVPIVVADAVASRQPAAHALALERLRAAGIEIVNTEMVVFEWLRVAGTPEFKALVKLIK